MEIRVVKSICDMSRLQLFYDRQKLNKLSMNSNTGLLLINFNIRSIGANFDAFKGTVP